MERPQINIIGCGKLGSVLGHLLVHKQVASVAAVCNASLASSAAAAKRLGPMVRACASVEELPPAAITLITTPDGMIAELCKRLVASAKALRPGSIVMHCSGALPSAVLLAAKQQACLIASVHPVKSFADFNSAVANFAGTPCAFEGDEATFSSIAALFQGIGGRVFRLASDKKALYHTASVMAHNYVVSLYDQALSCYSAAGLDAALAAELAATLASDALHTLQHLPPRQALTGPLQRGDAATIAGHLQALAQEKLSLSEGVYRALGLATLTLTSHPPSLREELTTLLEQ